VFPEVDFHMGGNTNADVLASVWTLSNVDDSSIDFTWNDALTQTASFTLTVGQAALQSQLAGKPLGALPSLLTGSPTANAGGPYTLPVGGSVTRNGGQSTDTNGGKLPAMAILHVLHWTSIK
jgi:hypothetical protein